jgi:Ca-activated chloride channel homolog
MNYNYELSTLEYWFIGVFLGLYAAYLGRTFWVAHGLHTPARAVVVKFFLRVIYLTLLIVSLMGPSFGESKRDIKATGKDIYVLIDVSRSMDTPDVPPSRIDKVKFELSKIVSELSDSRFGLIGFSTEAFVQAPLTYDYSAFNVFLETLSSEQTSGKGTNICTAVELATQKLLTTKHSSSSKIILLFTDGEDFGICENKTLATLRLYGIQLIAVGVGTTRGGRIKTPSGWVLDQDNQIVISKLDATYLQKITQRANGTYFEINGKSNTTARISDYLKGLENTSIETRQVIVKSNKYRYVLFVALLLIIFDVLVTITTFKI